jgi:hypothetical protein
MSAFWDLQLKDLLTILVLVVTVWAIWKGPQRAIEVSRTVSLEDEARRETRRRKYQVFYELMRTRGIVLHPEHVMALNLVQLVFYGNDAVQAAYRSYIQSLNRRRSQTRKRWSS